MEFIIGLAMLFIWWRGGATIRINNKKYNIEFYADKDA